VPALDSRSATSQRRDAIAAAAAAGLHYVNAGDAGYLRIGGKNGIQLRDRHGTLVRDARVRERVRRLVIPPAWTDVWICASPSGHIQAVGRDARGRKQYIYHPAWNALRGQTKFERLVPFARALPRIRARIARDLARRSMSKERVFAAVVQLLDLTHIRVGNEEYARRNNSFGLTTLRNRHVKATTGLVEFRFKAKSGKLQCIRLSDRRLVRIVKACQELPGQHLFQYVDAGGAPKAVTSSDVNGYLRTIAGNDFTAKDFRTWAGTVLAAVALCEPGTDSNADRTIPAAAKLVAARLGNTPAVCRKSYIHPAVIEGHLAGTLRPLLERAAADSRPRRVTGLSATEAAVLAFLSRKRSARRQTAIKA
jgi:DNA topoisomerase I